LIAFRVACVLFLPYLVRIGVLGRHKLYAFEIPERLCIVLAVVHPAPGGTAIASNGPALIFLILAFLTRPAQTVCPARFVCSGLRIRNGPLWLLFCLRGGVMLVSCA
jgi:hypothetical protein